MIRYVPIFGALALWIIKVLFQSLVGDYNLALGPCDIAFTGLSFDLWAYLTVSVYHHPLKYLEDEEPQPKDYATAFEKLLVLGLIFLHIFLFMIGVKLGMENAVFFEQWFYFLVPFAGFCAYAVPVMYLKRWFRGK